ncbi:MAG: hypothetical protein KatS3mg031_0834 [Chitinophagales bacterium]|nr:MAG: hypothetical protein KatS3mg031_0834 [Chitinophagales bacterium]
MAAPFHVLAGKVVLVILGFLLLLNACVQQTNHAEKTTVSLSETDSLQMMQTASEATLALQQTLSAALKKAMEDSGAAYAIHYCNLHVHPLTDSISEALRLNIARVSHRARNPKNQASADELRMIAAYEQQLAEEKPLKPILQKAGNQYTFYSPILIFSPLCLQCHGQPDTEIHPATLQAIQNLYPEDKATGFRLQDVRGLWRVEFRQ